MHLFEKNSIMDMVASDQNPVNVKLDDLWVQSLLGVMNSQPTKVFTSVHRGALSVYLFSFAM
jgi:hypothetical protein